VSPRARPYPFFFYHQVALDKYGVPVKFDDPLPPAVEPSEAEANHYLGLLKDAMGFDMYFAQKDASNGLELFRDLERRNTEHPDSALLHSFGKVQRVLVIEGAPTETEELAPLLSYRSAIHCILLRSLKVILPGLRNSIRRR
jgi:hypothetical protein